MTNNRQILLAKSPAYGGLTLADHTRHVVAAIEHFAATLNFDIEIARNGAILHDLGKAHPHFQNKIGGKKASLAQRRDFSRYKSHRHEISSIGFLPLFPSSQWQQLIDMVIAHHKSMANDNNGLGILDLVENDPDTLDFHFYYWDEWAPAALEVAKFFGINSYPISHDTALNALEYTKNHCATRPAGWSAWKGLLKAADHFASAFNHETEAILKKTFINPNLSWFHSEERKHNLYPLSLTDVSDPRPHTLVVAPTGAGKTDFLLRRCKGRVFYTLPFQAAINAMFDRIYRGVSQYMDTERIDVRLLHSISGLKVKENRTEQILQPLVGSSVKVLTPHQLSSIIFGTAGYETVMLDLKGCDVILDEIHTYTSWAGAMVYEIVRMLTHLGCRVHIGTATIPTALYNKLLDLIGGKSQVYEVRLREEVIKTFDRHIIYKEKDDEKNIVQILQRAFNKGEKVLYIRNTVKEAQNAYKMLRIEFPELPIMLIHSRFRRKDRARLEKLLIENFNDPKNTTYSPCLVISTQVVEVSLDISFDRMITACAPLDALIQRFGRVNRVRNEHTIGKFKPIHVLEPEGNYKPYSKEILTASFAQLPDGELIEECAMQAKIDAVYPTLDSKEIDMHLIFRNDNYVINELCHRAGSIIVDALEIESATCILEQDRLKYEQSSWEERIELEIPVPWSSIRYAPDKYSKLEIGAYPFVVPQAIEEHMELGLIFPEHNTIL